MRRLVLACFLLAAPALAQPAALSPDARAALVTVTPGDAVYNRWGHTALRITDPERGVDVLFNYGTFAFSETFVFSFAYGALDYTLSTSPPEASYRYYAQEGRGVVEQTLDLTPDETQRLWALLVDNAREENRTYRYHFLYDNCATRPRNIAEQAIGARLVYPAPPEGTTFRDLLRPYDAGAPALRLGLNLLLALPVDREVTTRTAAFLPLTLMEQMATATRAGGRPIVTRTDTLVAVAPLPAPAFDWPQALGWVLLGLGLVGLARGRRRPHRPSRWDAILFGLAGLAGCVLLAMWTLTLHDVTERNLNLFWLWPTHLAAAWWAMRKTQPRWLRTYWLVAAAATALVALLWFALPQDLPAAGLPVALLLAARALGQSRKPVRAAEPQVAAPPAAGRAIG